MLILSAAKVQYYRDKEGKYLFIKGQFLSKLPRGLYFSTFFLLFPSQVRSI